MASFTPKQVEAAQEFVQTTINTIGSDGNAHAGTAIAATALTPFAPVSHCWRSMLDEDNSQTHGS
jgi:hypothetical protein